MENEDLSEIPPYIQKMRERMVQVILKEDVEGLLRLLADGASLNLPISDDGLLETPLCHASMQGNFKIVKILVEHGAEIDGTFDGHTTSLTWAMMQNARPIVEYLMEKGANIQHDGCSPILFRAIMGASVEYVALLLERGADSQVVDLTGRNAVDWAYEMGNMEKVEYLLRHTPVRRVNRSVCLSEPVLAPVSEIVCYLAILRRMFRSIIEATESGNKGEIVLGGGIAQNIMHISTGLWHRLNGNHDLIDLIDNYMEMLQQNLITMHAPHHLVELAEHVCSLENGHLEFGLREDLADVVLPPVPKIRLYLDMLYHGCVSLRLIQCVNQFMYPPHVDLEQLWTEAADQYAENNRKLATIPLPVTEALVKWDQFDEEKFREIGEERLGQEWEDYWGKFQ